MPWPSPSDYQDAIQNPRLCFAAEELQGAEVARTPLGLPRVASGNFASVNELRSTRGRWAVRCFLRPVSDQERRYHEISEYLNAHPLPWLVDFDYLPRGIRVRGAWYPIVKMDWVDGVPLNRYVEDLLGQMSSLLAVAHQWRSLVAEVRGIGIAHNDYQHGNVLVTRGELRLVDYDGMFVPAFRGERAPELGRVNYQHPARRPEDYGPELDNFSAIVIYLALRALAFDPGLWRFHDGENMVLTAADFRAPGSSAALAQLRASEDPETRALAARLASLCALPVAQMPPLEAVLTATTAPAARRPSVAPTDPGVGSRHSSPGPSPPGAAAASGTVPPSSAGLPGTNARGRPGWLETSGASPAAPPSSASGATPTTLRGVPPSPPATGAVSAAGNPVTSSAGSTIGTTAPAATAAGPAPPAATTTPASSAPGTAAAAPATGGAAGAGAPSGGRSSRWLSKRKAAPAGRAPGTSAVTSVPSSGTAGGWLASMRRAGTAVVLFGLLMAGATSWWGYPWPDRVVPWLQLPAAAPTAPAGTRSQAPRVTPGPAAARPPGLPSSPPKTSSTRPAPATRSARVSNAGAPLLREATVQVATGRYSEAMETLNRARRLGLDLAQPATAREYYATMGRARLERGQYREAAPSLREASLRAPTDSGLLLDYALTLEKLGKRDAAREVYGRALRAPGTADQVAQARAGLQRLR